MLSQNHIKLKSEYANWIDYNSLLASLVQNSIYLIEGKFKQSYVCYAPINLSLVAVSIVCHRFWSSLVQVMA